MSNDLVGDMLVRIKNALMVKSREVNIVRTNLNLNIAKLLKQEGFIDNYEEFGNISAFNESFVSSSLRLVLKYKGVKQKPYITNIKRVSKPGFRVYTHYKNIPKIMGGIGIAVLSTSHGIMVDRTARAMKLGGEILFIIW